ncbi:MAG: DNA alkylation repair protein [Alistipes sp.]|nr:DNA alkylation repair protein [Alistipes sp.]
MKDNTSRMISLLGKMRKQMNGAVADSMYYYGKDYGLNYGVSLPTIRSIAKEEERDHEFALYLMRQQVRELKLAAMHIAEPAAISSDEISTWEDALINSELAEECAFALLGHAPQLKPIFHKWCESENIYATYAALMAMARNTPTTNELQLLPAVLQRHPDCRIITQGVIAMLDTAYHNPTLQQDVRHILESLEPSAQSSYITEEMEWRMELIQ